MKVYFISFQTFQEKPKFTRRIMEFKKRFIHILRIDYLKKLYYKYILWKNIRYTEESSENFMHRFIKGYLSMSNTKNAYYVYLSYFYL